MPVVSGISQYQQPTGYSMNMKPVISRSSRSGCMKPVRVTCLPSSSCRYFGKGRPELGGPRVVSVKSAQGSALTPVALIGRQRRRGRAGDSSGRFERNASVPACFSSCWRLVADRQLGQVVGRARAAAAGGGAAPGGCMPNCVDAAVEDRRGGADVAVGVGQLGELPEQPAVGGQPQGELLHEGDRVGRAASSSRRRRACPARTRPGRRRSGRRTGRRAPGRPAARAGAAGPASGAAPRPSGTCRAPAGPPAASTSAAWARSPCSCQAVPRLAAMRK